MTFGANSPLAPDPIEKEVKGRKIKQLQDKLPGPNFNFFRLFRHWKRSRYKLCQNFSFSGRHKRTLKNGIWRKQPPGSLPGRKRKQLQDKIPGPNFIFFQVIQTLKKGSVKIMSKVLIFWTTQAGVNKNDIWCKQPAGSRSPFEIEIKGRKIKQLQDKLPGPNFTFF